LGRRDMELTREEERLLTGEKGPRVQECMRILAALGDLYGARRLVPVWSVQLSGISFKTMGVPGTEFLEDMAREVKFAVPTTINPAGYDVGGPGLVQTSPEFKEKQDRIVRALTTLGAIPTFSCTPYTTEFAPPPGGPSGLGGELGGDLREQRPRFLLQPGGRPQRPGERGHRQDPGLRSAPPRGPAPPGGGGCGHLQGTDALHRPRGRTWERSWARRSRTFGGSGQTWMGSRRSAVA